MFGLDPECGIKMMEIKVAEMNATKCSQKLTQLKSTRIFIICVILVER